MPESQIPKPHILYVDASEIESSALVICNGDTIYYEDHDKGCSNLYWPAREIAQQLSAILGVELHEVEVTREDLGLGKFEAWHYGDLRVTALKKIGYDQGEEDA